MPSAAEILQQLAAITSGWRALALAWHVYFGTIAIGLVVGARPSRRIVGVLLALPLLSVSLLAWGVGNPFNGSVFALAAIAFLGLALTLPPTPAAIARGWMSAAGILMAAFGWTYPHFLGAAASPVEYLYAAPTGLIPCPTLAMLIGLTLIVEGLGSRAWSMSMAALGAAYGIIGGAILGVAIDGFLALGAFALLITAWRRPVRERS
jgi:hypothetical protein